MVQNTWIQGYWGHQGKWFGPQSLQYPQINTFLYIKLCVEIVCFKSQAESVNISAHVSNMLALLSIYKWHDKVPTRWQRKGVILHMRFCISQSLQIFYIQQSCEIISPLAVCLVKRRKTFPDFLLTWLCSVLFWTRDAR